MAFTLSGWQCRAARTLLRWQQSELAERAGLETEAVADFEASQLFRPLASAALLKTLTRNGITWPDHRPHLDGHPFNPRTDNGIPTGDSDCAPEDWGFRHDPLPNPHAIAPDAFR
jgi:transcriptional regulator with XRE-family HTH domain